jgi:predicted metal-dependent peptidase
VAIGDIPAGLVRELNELENPSLPWHRILRQRLALAIRRRSWLRPAKKFLPMYFPGVKKEKGLNAVVAFDTSGSMSADDLTQAMSETIGLAESFPSVHMWVIFNDAKVWEVIEVKNGERTKLKSLKPKGGGGTEFKPVFESIKKNFNDKIDCLVFFTDGYCYDSWPKKPKYNVFWVSRSTSIDWPFGQYVSLKSD